MEKVLLQEAIKLNTARKHRKWWHHLVRIAEAEVVFCTTYALILPAITMTRETVCGLEDHVHGEECYAIRTMTELTCTGQTADAEIVFHAHDALCYDAEGTLRCNLTEQEQLVIRLRYGLFGSKVHRQREVSAVTGISRSYVSRIEKRALEKLRKRLES